MKKLTLKSLVEQDELMYFHSFLFRDAHGFMRKHNVFIQIGMQKENLNEFYFYHKDEDVLDLFINETRVFGLIERGVYLKTIETAGSLEPVLIRASNFNPREKAKKMLAYVKKKFGKLSEVKMGKKVNYDNLVSHFKEVKEKQREIYFIVLKDDKPLSIFASFGFADPKMADPNSYGLGKKSHVH